MSRPPPKSEEPKPEKKPKSESHYTGRKGAVTSRTIGSESPYKFVSRAFRKALEAVTKKRGPTQDEVAEAKRRLKSDDAAWRYWRQTNGLEAP